MDEWGSYGFADGEFTGTGGIAIDSQDNVYVSSPFCGRCDVQKFDSSGQFLGKWGTEGSANGQFRVPTGIGVNANDQIFVVDQGNVRVQKFDSDGDYLEQWGASGLEDGQFERPAGVATRAAGAEVYVTDSDVHRVQKFTVDDSVAPPAAPTGLSVTPSLPRHLDRPRASAVPLQ